ncbi:putative defense protein 3 [Halyomorpha halys]|uniref:putative defense protein 3 n=1 Tax=Halyomorpha halys TaxID=286706 RepID=UPI0034D357A3
MLEQHFGGMLKVKGRTVIVIRFRYSPKVLFLFVAVIATGSAYPTGAPTDVCETMAPGHGAVPQASPFPYDIVIEKPDLKGGETTKVTIRGKEGIPFRGYMMQARSEDKKPIGVFTAPDSSSHTLDCGSGKANTVTQSNANDKKEVSVIWKAPKAFKGKVVFTVTVVKVFDIYWVAQPSSAVKIS